MTRWFERKRYAAFVFAQSWQTNGMLSPVLSENCWKSFLNRLLSRASRNSLPANSRSIQLLVWEAVAWSIRSEWCDSCRLVIDAVSPYAGLTQSQCSGGLQRFNQLDNRTYWNCPKVVGN